MAALAAAALTAREAQALDPATPIAQLTQRVWSLEEGLPQASVRAVVQTPDGHLWIGTDGGLARFDGVEFTVFSAENTPVMRNHQVRGLVVDRSGDLWVALNGQPGLLRYRAGAFESFEKAL